MLTRDKVRGVFAGIAIGDALGMPVELWDHKKINDVYGYIKNYVSPTTRNCEAGDTTDDTQLTLAVAESIIESNGNVDVDNIAKWHVKALSKGTMGWGSTTRNSVLNIKKGVNWPDSSKSDNPRSGVGNGIIMKVAPVGVLSAKTNDRSIYQKIVDLSSITHHSKMAALSGIIHTKAIEFLLCDSVDRFNTADFIDYVAKLDDFSIDHLTDTEDNIVERMNDLYSSFLSQFLPMSVFSIIEKYRGGCYVYESLPFSYALFLKNPYNIETLYDTVNAGGDTDSNASVVGGMLGALHGINFFPKHLLTGVYNMPDIIKTADRLSQALEIN